MTNEELVIKNRNNKLNETNYNKCGELMRIIEYNNAHIKTFSRYKTKEEAFLVYKQAKEKYIKQVADEYKDKIPKRLYDAMYKYEVEITD